MDGELKVKCRDVVHGKRNKCMIESGDVIKETFNTLCILAF